MNEKQAFSLLVRAIGILVFLDGLKVFSTTLLQWEFQFLMPHDMPFAVVAPSLVYGLLAMLLGAVMTRWPCWLVRLAWLERLPTIGRME